VKAGNLVEADGSLSDAVDPTAAQRRRAPLPLLTAIAPEQWRDLAGRAIEPNGYYLPDWELAVNASARGRSGARALTAWNHASDARHDALPQLSGFLPVVSAWDAYRLPLKALVSADPYGTLGTPPIDRDMTADAVAGLLQRARAAGARALVLRNMSLDGLDRAALARAPA